MSYNMTEITAENPRHLDDLCGLLTTRFNGAVKAELAWWDEKGLTLAVTSNTPAHKPKDVLSRKDQRHLRSLGYTVQNTVVMGG